MRRLMAKILIFFLIFGVSFSDIPFYAVTEAINSYIAINNIVDKSWHLSQDDNVVDKFTSYRHLAEKVKIYKAYAASLEYVGGAEASGNNAAYNVSLTGLIGGSGSTAQSGDLVIVATGFVSTSNGNPGVGTAGYTEEADLYGNDTRDANFSVNWKIMGGTPDTSVSCNGSGSATNGAVCVVHVWRNADPNNPMDVAPTTGSSNNSAIPDSPAITPVTAGAVMISTGLGTGAANDTSVTAPTGYANQVDISVDPGNAAIVGIASKLWGGSGAEDPAAWSTWTTSTSDSRTMATLAIRPAPSNNPPSITVAQPDGTGDTVTVGDLYDITYDLSDVEDVATAGFYYDTNASGLDGTAITGCQNQPEGTGATCSWDTTGMTPGSYYVYGVADDGVNPTVSDYSPGVITINAPPAGPDATSYANGTETALNFANCATTGCGARITTGADQTVTVSGSAFGTVSAGSRANCAGGAGTGCVRIANYTVPDANVIAWTDTSIQFRIPSGVTVYGGSGTACGGADGNGLCITAAGADDAGGALQFFVFPDVTSISPTPSTGAKEGDSITISGNRFGAARGTGSIKFQNCGGGSDVNVVTYSSWNDTTAIVIVPSGIADNDDSCDILLTRDSGTGSKTDTSNNTANNLGTFVILPSITGMASIGSNAAREYDGAGDTDGLVKLVGNHFGTTAGSAAFTGGFGVSAAVHSTAEGSCDVGGWAAAGTSVCIEVNNTIANNVYTGTITLTRTGDSKTDLISFRVLPQIISNTPTSGALGDAIQIDGDHFCQSGTCPSAPPTAGDKTEFGTTAAISSDFVTTCTGGSKWTDSRICVKVPSTAPTGSQPTKITSNTSYTSDTKAFSVLSTGPNDPTGLTQYKLDGITVIAENGGTNGTSTVLEGDIAAGTSISMRLEVEVQLKSAAFDGTISGSSAGCTGTSCSNEQIIISGLQNGSEYKWRARTKNISTSETSNWVNFGTNGDGNARDFFIDTSAPTISGVGTAPSCTAHTNVTDVGATISWGSGDAFNSSSIANSVRYGTDPSLSSGTTVSANDGISPTKDIAGLTAGTTYYYWVKSVDSVINASQSPSGSPFCQFTTSAAVKRINKTTEYYICQDTGTSPLWTGGSGVACGSSGAKAFNIYIAEHTAANPITELSGYIEISGITNASTPFDVIVGINGSATTTYTVASPGGASLPWSIIYPVPSFNIDYSADLSASNLIDIDFAGTINSTSVLGAKAVITYYYIPQ